MAADAVPSSTEQKVLLEVEHLSKSFDELQVLVDLSLVVHERETVTVLGKSGSGKSVLLKLIAGLLQPDSGHVKFRGKAVDEMTEHELAETRKHMGFLFQGAALFDSMTVGENLEMFLLRHTTLSAPEREKKIADALSVVELSEVIDKMPSELSGGMRKRAGLARAIVLEPKLILYDEPTTGLDPLTAETIAELIVTLQTRLGIASVVVTHDLPTAFVVTDRAVILNAGVAIYDGPIVDLRKSADPFLRSYLEASSISGSRREHLLERIAKDQAPHQTGKPIAYEA